MGPQGFLPVSHEVPGGLSVAGRAEEVGEGWLFDLLCLCGCWGGGSMYVEREGAKLSTVKTEARLYQSSGFSPVSPVRVA